jgi:acyl-CoA thioesterase FadM
MHGMYLISRASGASQNAMAKQPGGLSFPLEVSTKFQRPCVLPQKVMFRAYSMKSSPKTVYFSVKGKGDKVLLDGYLKHIPL